MPYLDRDREYYLQNHPHSSRIEDYHLLTNQNL